jgi:adenylate cyclase
LDVEVPSLAGASGGGKIGLRGRLLLAFAGISMFAVVAGLSGRYAFTEFTKALDRTEATIPPALAAVELTRESEQVLAAGPRLLNVQTSNAVETLSAEATSDLENVRRLVAQLRTTSLESGALADFSSTILKLGDNLLQLKTISLERVNAASHREKLVSDTFDAYRQFGLAWNRQYAELQSQVLQLRNALNLASTPQERRSAIDHFDQAVATSLSLEQVQREAGLVFEFLTRATSVDDIVSLEGQASEARRALRALEGRIEDLDRELAAGLVEPAKRLHSIVLDRTGLFITRHREIEVIGNGRRLVASNEALADKLSLAVSELVSRARKDIDTETAEARSAQKFGETIQLGAIALSLISSGLIVWLYVGRNVVARITALSSSTLAIAAGRRDVPVAVGGSDEVAAMARAVEVFRANAIALDQLLAERAQAAERLEKTVEERTAELQRQGDVLRVTFDNMADGVVMFDKNMRLAARNPRFEEILELPATFFSAEKRYPDFLRFLAERGEYGQIDVEAQVNRLVGDVGKHSKYERNRPDGTVLEIRHNPLPGGGWVSIYSDITDRKHYEEALTAALDQAEAASRTKSSFLANMSHELRTPLNAILGYTELILDNLYGETPDKMRAVLKRLERNSKHLLGLINDVLDLSKIEAGQLSLSLDDYSIQEVVHSVYNVVEPLAEEKGLALKIEVPPNLPRGRGDERRLTQVLLNLVGNAIKFTDAGEVAIKASAANGSFTVSVCDTGPGISVADQTKLFEDFQQIDNSTTKKKGGTGLGLAISKRIITMHGGHIWVESSSGHGSTFSFTLPITVVPPASPA